MPRRVLLVEDDAAVRRSLARALGENEVVLADCAEPALARFAETAAEVVLTGVRMPGMDAVLRPVAAKNELDLAVPDATRRLLDPRIRALALSASERDDLVVFLQALTGAESSQGPLPPARRAMVTSPATP